MLKQAPNKTNFKFNKFHKIKYSYSNINNKSFFLRFGSYGLQSLESTKMTYKHLETGRIILRKFMLKKGIIWIKVFPWSAYTRKPVGARMGKGKGKHYGWVAPIKSGTIIYEISGVNSVVANRALTKCGLRMPFKFKVVKLIY